jgi:hypothetical protein
MSFVKTDDEAMSTTGWEQCDFVRSGKKGAIAKNQI